MFPDSSQDTTFDSLATPGIAGMIGMSCFPKDTEVPEEDSFLAPWMHASMSDADDEYFDDLDDEDFDDEFDDDFEEELNDDLAALNPEVTEEDLVEADDDLGGMFDDDEEGGAAREEAEPAAEPEEED